MSPVLPLAFAFIFSWVIVNWCNVGKWKIRTAIGLKKAVCQNTRNSPRLRDNLFHLRTKIEKLLFFSNKRSYYEDLLCACLRCSGAVGVIVISSKWKGCLLPQALWERQGIGRWWVNSILQHQFLVIHWLLIFLYFFVPGGHILGAATQKITLDIV